MTYFVLRSLENLGTNYVMICAQDQDFLNLVSLGCTAAVILVQTIAATFDVDTVHTEGLC